MVLARTWAGRCGEGGRRRGIGADLGEGVEGVFDLVGGGEGAEGEAGGTAGVECVEGGVCSRGAVDAGSGEDSELCFEDVGEVCGGDGFVCEAEDADAVGRR